MTAHPSPEEKYIGAEIGSFRIVRCIGAGGMGTVFLAQHTTVDLRVAIKVLRDLSTAGPQAAARFQLEAKVLSRLDHQSLVKLQDCGTLPDGTLYLQTEFLEGQPLAASLQEHGGRLPPETVLRWGRQMASALAYVHQQGVLHRDLKPSNLYVVADQETAGGQRIKILDFGIAKLRSSAGSQTSSQPTQSGQIVGTPRYMSPEQCEGIADLDDRSDVYSLGLILFELLTGQSPYQPEPKEAMGWLLAHVQRRSRTLRQALPDASESLSALIKQMLDKLAAQRPSMAEVEAQLAALLLGATPPKRAAPPWEKRPRGTTLALAAVLGTGGLLFLPTLRGWIWQRISSGRGSSPDTARRLTLQALQARAPRGTAVVPGGRFLLGSSEQDIDAALADCQRHRTDCQRDEYERERPQYVVTVSDFYLSGRSRMPIMQRS